MPSLFPYIFLLCLLHMQCLARDTITIQDSISDSRGESLVSSGERFELGFFTPNGSSGSRRYVGIWYYLSNPLTVVWVANRDNPVLDHKGVFSVSEDGNLKVLDERGRCYWSTHLETNCSMERNLKLLDTGNLILHKGNEEDRVIWQTFENPTDTFLPGMKMDENVTLISWRSYNDPACGNFSFQSDQEGEQFTIWKRSIRYWRSGVSGNEDEIPSPISYFLSNFTAKVAHNDSVPYITSTLFDDTRMVMSFTGQIQYLKWDSQKVWTLFWAVPRTRCSLYNACGNFGSCNSNNEVVCKCLPGFQPAMPEYWNSGDYSGGCSRRSPLCSDNASPDLFLNLKMMKVGKPDSQFKARSETECKTECLNNCQCQAFSFEETTDQKGIEYNVANCWIWLEDLTDLQEEYDNGHNINVRVSVSGIDLTSRTCGICGSNIIPYPLSTATSCGDLAYFRFYCNISTGQLSFQTSGGNYRVTNIDPNLHKFVIQIDNAKDCKALNSTSKFLQPNQSLPFHVIRWCRADLGNYTSDGGEDLELSWDPPQEPTCSSSADCKDWPNSTCSSNRSDGKKKCLCNKGFQWNGLMLNCTQEGKHGKQANGSSLGMVPSSLITSVALVSFVVFLLLTSAAVFAYLQKRKWESEQGNWGASQRHTGIQLSSSERLVKDIIDSGRFNENETLPFFPLESILAATNNFSNANKLGQGGFGPVYKAKFPGGAEVAVKRLSSSSGQGLEEFKNEVVLIAKLQHRNLVRLLGYCVEGDEKMLLYEYMPNKSLDFFLFDRKLCVALDWEMRYNIIVGIGRGLVYLHQDSRLRIIHRDLKTSNILLDEEMNPKISDFGLARILEGKESAANTNRVVGTYGYIAPEYALDGLFSFKSDVFSFGVVVLEIISGKRNVGFYQVEQSLSLLGYAWKLWKEVKGMELIDENARKSCKESEYMKCLKVGLLCVQEDPSERPTMSNVMIMLSSENASVPDPKQPAFVTRRCPSSSRASSSTKPETCSNNALTVTLEDGR